jgi:hypothetical protein
MLRCCDRRNTGCPAGKSRCEQPQEVCQGFASELQFYPDCLSTKSRLLRNQEMPGLLRKSCAGPISAEGIPTACRYPGKKTSFLSVCFFKHLKTIFLPRQARDKHRENSKKTHFLADSCHAISPTHPPGPPPPHTAGYIVSGAGNKECNGKYYPVEHPTGKPAYRRRFRD